MYLAGATTPRAGSAPSATAHDVEEKPFLGAPPRDAAGYKNEVVVRGDDGTTCGDVGCSKEASSCLCALLLVRQADRSENRVDMSLT